MNTVIYKSKCIYLSNPLSAGVEVLVLPFVMIEGKFQGQDFSVSVYMHSYLYLQEVAIVVNIL